MAMLGARRKTVKPGWEQAVSLRNDPFDFGQIAARADGIFGPRDDMADAAPIGIPQTGMEGFAAPRIKPRFFGQGGAGRKIAGALGDALLTATGGQAVYAPAMRDRQEFEQRSRLFREKLDFEREEAETKRNAPMQVGDNVVQYDPSTGGYKSLYSAPPELTQFQRDLAAVGIAPDSEEARQIMRNRYNPFKTAEIPDGEGGKITVQTGGAPLGGDLPQDVVQYFQSQGISPEVARGIAAGIVSESSGDHTAVNPDSGAFGLGQHLGPRKAAMFRRYGQNPTRAQQMEFLLSELKGGDPGGASVLSARDEKAAADAYIRNFMRPGKDTETGVARALRALNGGAGPRVLGRTPAKPKDAPKPRQGKIKPGTAMNGFVFTGGDPRDRTNWRKQ